jgi:hypothetical protein
MNTNERQLRNEGGMAFTKLFRGVNRRAYAFAVVRWRSLTVVDVRWRSLVFIDLR